MNRPIQRRPAALKTEEETMSEIRVLANLGDVSAQRILAGMSRNTTHQACPAMTPAEARAVMKQRSARRVQASLDEELAQLKERDPLDPVSQREWERRMQHRAATAIRADTPMSFEQQNASFQRLWGSR